MKAKDGKKLFALVFYGLGFLAVKYFKAEEEFYFIPTNLLDVTVTLAVATIFIVLGNRLRKGAGNAKKYLQILTAIFVIFVAVNLVVYQRLGVGILGLLVLGYLFLALYGIRKVRVLAAINQVSVDTNTPANAPVVTATPTSNQRTAVAIAIIIAATLVAGALYFAKTSDNSQNNMPSVQDEEKQIVQNCAKSVEEMRIAGDKESLDCHFKASKFLRDRSDPSGLTSEIMHGSCEDEKITIIEEEQLMKRCLRQNGIY